MPRRLKDSSIGVTSLANHDGHPSAEFLCLDRHPQGKEARDDNGALFRYTHAACGSLPLPPVHQQLYCDVRCLLAVAEVKRAREGGGRRVSGEVEFVN